MWKVCAAALDERDKFLSRKLMRAGPSIKYHALTPAALLKPFFAQGLLCAVNELAPMQKPV